MGWLSRLGSWIKLLFGEAWSWFFPKRASTRTWMFITFAFFVGTAVLAIGLYARLILAGQTENATRQIMEEQSLRLARSLEQVDTEEDRNRIAQEAAELLNNRILVTDDDEVLIDVQSETFRSESNLQETLDLRRGRHGRIRTLERRSADGIPIIQSTFYDQQTDYTIHLVFIEPPLYALLTQMQILLIVGMVMALILSLFGSWVAARRVTKPLQAINESARNISEDQYEGKIYVDSRATEFQDLAKSLNKMSGQFQDKIQELERLARLQSEFIGNVSHEVRNPIFAVSGYLEALASPTLSPELQKRYAEKGLINLERLNNLFNDLIEIARLEYREDLIRPHVFNLKDLTDEILEMLRPKAEEKGLELEADNEPIDVVADRNRIRQVLVNLIENAIVYTDEGSVRFRYRRRQEKIRLEIIDTGRGIPEDHLDRIFERFYRVDPDRSRKSGGTGLGLSIVHQILQSHGEEIHVESTIGRGTRFWFDLPYAERVAAE